VKAMALTRNFKKTVVARVGRDPAFARALLDQAATLFLSGEPETARLVLRDLVNATLTMVLVRSVRDEDFVSVRSVALAAKAMVPRDSDGDESQK
jgi:hypothetical protein